MSGHLGKRFIAQWLFALFITIKLTGLSKSTRRKLIMWNSNLLGHSNEPGGKGVKWNRFSLRFRSTPTAFVRKLKTGRLIRCRNASYCYQLRVSENCKLNKGRNTSTPVSQDSCPSFFFSFLSFCCSLFCLLVVVLFVFSFWSRRWAREWHLQRSRIAWQ